MVGKISDNAAAPIWVVAGALQGRDGRWLMHRRPFDKHHGGLWEFPGGKVEGAEKPIEALVRELEEELAINVMPDACWPVAFAEDRSAAASPAIVILLYKITDWAGEPRAVEGEEIRWFDAAGVMALEKPPLDRELAHNLFEKA